MAAKDPHEFSALLRTQYELKTARRVLWHDEPEFEGSMNHLVGVVVSERNLSHPVGSRIQQETLTKFETL